MPRSRSVTRSRKVHDVLTHRIIWCGLYFTKSHSATPSHPSLEFLVEPIATPLLGAGSCVPVREKIGRTPRVCLGSSKAFCGLSVEAPIPLLFLTLDNPQMGLVLSTMGMRSARLLIDVAGHRVPVNASATYYSTGMDGTSVADFL
jgi:hypothetical protein